MQLFFDIYVNWHSGVTEVLISISHNPLQDTLNYSTLVSKFFSVLLVPSLYFSELANGSRATALNEVGKVHTVTTSSSLFCDHRTFTVAAVLVVKIQ